MTLHVNWKDWRFPIVRIFKGKTDRERYFLSQFADWVVLCGPFKLIKVATHEVE